MKIKLYPKDLLEAAWRKDKKLYADGDDAEPPQCLAVRRPSGSPPDGQCPQPLCGCADL